MKWRSLHSEKAPLHLYFLDFLSLFFFFFSLERYLKTGVSHLQLITFLVFYQEFKILTVSMWWHERKKKKPTFSLQPVKSDSGSQSALCLSIPCSAAQLLWIILHPPPKIKKCHAEGKIGKGQETSPHLGARAELSFCGWNSLFPEFHWLFNVGQCMGGSLPQEVLNIQVPSII